jgi:hypothetical protein
VKYTVVWRDDGDDYMFTPVDIGVLDPLQLSAIEWALAAADVEYAEFDESEQTAAKADLLDGFELLAVFAGEPEYVY